MTFYYSMLSPDFLEKLSPEDKDRYILTGLEREFAELKRKIGGVRTIEAQTERVNKFAYRIDEYKQLIPTPSKLSELETGILQLLIDLEPEKDISSITVPIVLSSAHLELLSKFIKAENPERFIDSEGWRVSFEDALKEPLRKVINRLIRGKYLIPPNLSQLLEYGFTVNDLKEFCRKRGLKVTGKKDELVERLVIADELGMKNKVENFSAYICSAKTKKAVQNYQDAKKQKYVKAEEVVLSAFGERNFKLATRTMLNYRANQAFHWDDDWKHKKEEDFIPTLKIIFAETPTILKYIPSDKLDILRVLAGREYLLRNPNPSLFRGLEDISEKFDNPTCVKMMLSYAINKITLDDIRKEARNNIYITGIEISFTDDEISCKECRKQANKTYRLEGVIPELPNPKCTNAHGCMCQYNAKYDFGVDDDELPEDKL